MSPVVRRFPWRLFAWGALLVLALEALPRLLSAPGLWPAWPRVIWRSMQASLIWAALGPLIWNAAGPWPAHRAPRDTRASSRPLGIGIAVLAATVLEAWWTRWSYDAGAVDFVDWWIRRGDRALYTGMAIAAARMGRDHLARCAAEAAATLRQQAALRRAQLLRLDRQLQPHFLFNALNTVAELVHHNAARAAALIDDIIRLFEDMGRLVPGTRSLGDELAALEPYLTVQHARFGPRLGMSVDVPPTLRSRLVPALVLQPLVENAIRHGVERLTEGGQVSIRAVDEGAVLRLTVTNPVAADDGARDSTSGIGLANARERLDCLYGSAATCTFLIRDNLAMLEVAIPRQPIHSLTDDLPEPASHEARPDPSTRQPKDREALHAMRFAVIAWLTVGAVWLGWAGLASWRTGTPFWDIVGPPVTFVRELAILLSLTLGMILLLSHPRVSAVPVGGRIWGQVVVAVLVFTAATRHIAVSEATYQQQLAGAAIIETRAAAGLAILLGVNAWRWHVEQLALRVQAWEAATQRAEIERAARLSHLDTPAIVRALREIARHAPRAPARADEIVVALARSLRQTLTGLTAPTATSKSGRARTMRVRQRSVSGRGRT